MSIILGIDPGSRLTGFGVIKTTGYKSSYIVSGAIKITSKNFPERLAQIFHSLTKVIDEYQPDCASIENVFVHKNVAAALKLGQARGAAITAVTTKNITVAEYSPREIKKAIVGYGAASKIQVQSMVKQLLNLTGEIQADAADALAIALCHAHSMPRGIIK